MELFIAILIYFGMVTPDAAALMSPAEKSFLVSSNQALITATLKDPILLQAIPTTQPIDRLED